MVKKWVFICLLALSGCSVLKEPAPNVKTSSMDVQAQLLEATQSIEQSLTVLAATEKAENPPVLDVSDLITPEGGMSGKVDIDWIGPIGPLIKKIANMTDYRAKFLGREPAIPVLVSVTQQNTMLAEILQNASLQAGKRAHIVVFPTDKVIEVRYLE